MEGRMSVEFRCKRSGNTVSFSREEDIASMRKEQGYEEVKDAVQEIKREEAIKKVVGRPKKYEQAVI